MVKQITIYPILDNNDIVRVIPDRATIKFTFGDVSIEYVHTGIHCQKRLYEVDFVLPEMSQLSATMWTRKDIAEIYTPIFIFRSPRQDKDELHVSISKRFPYGDYIVHID